MINEIFFKNGPALQYIFKLGLEPKEEIFYEFTEEQYDELKNQYEQINEAMFMLIPDEYKDQISKGVLIVSQSEKDSIINATKIIDNYCSSSNQTFNTFDDKLKYVSSLLPDVFTEGTKYHKYKRFKVIK